MNQPAPLTAEDVELFEALRKEDLEYSPAHHWQQLEGLTTDAIVEEAIRATQEVCAGDTEDPSEPEYDDAQKDRLRQEWLCFIRGGGISSLSWTLKAWLHDRSPTIFDRQADWKPPPATPISKAQAARGREIDAEVASLKGNALTLYAEKALLEADKKDLQAALEGTATAAAIRADTKPKRVTEDFLAKVRGCITSEDNPIVRAFKVGEAKKVHYLVCQDGTEIRLGTSREIGTTGAIEAAILNDAPMMRVVALKPAERSDLARAICNLCVQVDVGSEKEEAANWIRSYLAQSTIIEAGDSMKAA